MIDGTIPYDVRFFRSLDRMLQIEPWIERDRAMIDPLKTLGIEKGKPFDPDARTTEVLKSAAQEALALFGHRASLLSAAPCARVCSRISCRQRRRTSLTRRWVSASDATPLPGCEERYASSRENYRQNE